MLGKSVLYPFEELSAVFIRNEIVVCKLCQFGGVKFVVWERVKPYPAEFKLLAIIRIPIGKMTWAGVSMTKNY